MCEVRRAAQPRAHIDVVHRAALEPGAVVVGGQRQVQLAASGQKIVHDRVRLPAHRGDANRSTSAALGGVASRCVLKPLKHRLHIGPAPAGVATFAPVVKVAGLTTHIDHGVDGARAAQHLATRRVHGAPVQRRLGHGAVHPVEGRIEIRFGVARRQLQPRAVGFAASLDQGYAVAAIGAQAVGQHTASRATAHDHVVDVHSALSWFQRWRQASSSAATS